MRHLVVFLNYRDYQPRQHRLISYQLSKHNIDIEVTSITWVVSSKSKQKMTAANLLNLNVDMLFEQHSVPEIDIIQKKIQGVVEQKREELRTMVGERYRDLLQAADTIASMQTSGDTLITQINDITSNCRSLNEKQLIGFKDNDTTEQIRQRNTNRELNNYFSTMVQIKLLTSLPEMIWSQIDQEHFYAATELFIFSRHISTGLQLDAKNALMQQLPVAKKQWEILKPFHLTIKQCVVSVLEREDLNAEVTADCLLSFLLLEKSSFNGVAKKFLQLRCAAFRCCLTDDAANEETALRRIKERILASLKVLYGTMELLGKCLLENGLVFQRLAEYTDGQVPPTIALMDEAQYAHLLPEIISNFHPKFDVQSLDKTHVAASIEQWIEDIKLIAEVHLKKLFNMVSNMSTIQEIKHKGNDFKKDLNFGPIVKYFNLKHSLDFYDTEYVPLINQRVRDIIENSWSLAMTNLQQSLENVLSNENLMELNIWQEHPNELPASLEIALSEERKIKNLLMKTRGYDSQIIELFTTFDANISAIIAEMNVILEEPLTRAEDKVDLVEFLRQTSEYQLHEFISKLKALNFSKTQRKQLLFVVRCCVALVELCPHLKICFCQQASWRKWINDSVQHANTASVNWKRVCLLIEEETQRFWTQFVDRILDEHNCGEQLPTSLTHAILLEDFVHWESLTLDQKDEHDNTVTQSFRIPNQPRISLQTYLFSLIHILNTSVPQTLPSKILHIFNQKLLSQILSHYKILSSDKSLATNQCMALQLYFDLKFLQSLFQISRDESILNEKFLELQSAFKEFVDPFDIELFAEHIAGNVLRSVTRLGCQFGVLVSGSSSNSTTVSLTQEKDPNVLSLSASASTSVWFPLLPIVNKTAEERRSSSMETEKKRATITSSSSTSTTPTRKSSSRKSTDSNPKTKSTGATSFFGAMSQEWFR